jgi:hypothetical protein
MWPFTGLLPFSELWLYEPCAMSWRFWYQPVLLTAYVLWVQFAIQHWNLNSAVASRLRQTGYGYVVTSFVLGMWHSMVPYMLDFGIMWSCIVYLAHTGVICVFEGVFASQLEFFDWEMACYYRFLQKTWRRVCPNVVGLELVVNNIHTNQPPYKNVWAGYVEFLCLYPNQKQETKKWHDKRTEMRNGSGQTDTNRTPYTLEKVEKLLQTSEQTEVKCHSWHFAICAALPARLSLCLLLVIMWHVPGGLAKLYAYLWTILNNAAIRMEHALRLERLRRK